MKTIADLLREESKNLNGFVYVNKPYSCGLDESCTFFKNYSIPTGYSIEREEKQITISIKPFKGSGKRKLYVIKLWVS